MKKLTYEERGAKFAEVLAKRFEGCVTFDDFRREIQRYNTTHVRKLNWDHGVSRIAILRADYVIKFDFAPTGWFSDGHAGNCSSEEAVYARAVADGMEHLLAKTTVLTFHGLTCSIMPRIKGVGTRYGWERTVTPKEEAWLSDNLKDNIARVGIKQATGLSINHGAIAAGSLVDFTGALIVQEAESEGYGGDGLGRRVVDAWCNLELGVVRSCKTKHIVGRAVIIDDKKCRISVGGKCMLGVVIVASLIAG